jgi:hypothetical protein
MTIQHPDCLHYEFERIFLSNFNFIINFGITNRVCLLLRYFLVGFSQIWDFLG